MLLPVKGDALFEAGRAAVIVGATCTAVLLQRKEIAEGSCRNRRARGFALALQHSLACQSGALVSHRPRVHFRESGSRNQRGWGGSRTGDRPGGSNELQRHNQGARLRAYLHQPGNARASANLPGLPFADANHRPSQGYRNACLPAWPVPPRQPLTAKHPAVQQPDCCLTAEHAERTAPVRVFSHLSLRSLRSRR